LPFILKNNQMPQKQCFTLLLVFDKISESVTILFNIVIDTISEKIHYLGYLGIHDGNWKK
jgi:hypothetical protein